MASVLTDSQVKKINTLLLSGMSIHEVCYEAGFSVDTFKKYYAKDFQDILYSEERKKNKRALRLTGCKNILKVEQPEEQQKNIFDFKLNKKSAITISLAVIRMAIKDKDLYFFKSGNYLIYALVAGLEYTVDDYIKLIERVEDENINNQENGISLSFGVDKSKK